MLKRSLTLGLTIVALVLAFTPKTMAEGIGSRFILQDHDGKFVQDASFQGGFMLITFGYSFCPDICPTALSTMGTAMDGLGEKAQHVIPIFITVDPERDTVRQLHDYVPNFHPRLVGLTGSKEMIDRVAQGYKVRYEKVESEDKDPGAYTIDHTASIFLMGPNGQFLVKFIHNMDPDAMAKRILDFF